MLAFGPTARGKDGHDAMFCCGTNVVFRRAALEDVGGFPQDSGDEDFELSIRLHERGWRSRYVLEVLAHGLGPEIVVQQSSLDHDRCVCAREPRSGEARTVLRESSVRVR